jgi:hypothetical protein
MISEVFRFALLRQLSAIAGDRDSGSLAFEVQNESEFIDLVRRNREPHLRNKLLKIVQGYISSSQYAGTGVNVDSRLVDFSGQLSRLAPVGFLDHARAALKQAFGVDAPALLGDQQFATAHEQLGDSIVAANIAYTVPSDDRSRLTNLVGAWSIASALGAGAQPSKSDYDQTIIVLPKGIFPLPRRSLDRGGPDIERRLAAARVERARIARSVEHLRAAVDEIVTTLRAGDAFAPTPARRRGRRPPARRLGFMLNAGQGSSLSNPTREALRKVRLTGEVDASRAIELLEARIATESASLYRRGRDARMVRIGSTLLPIDVFTPFVGDVITEDTGRHAGPCPPPAVEPAGSETGPVTVPTGHGRAKILGIAELMLVEQQLSRYELGEIAHIENVLAGETRERSNRIATTVEESVTTETEEVEETQKDLSTAERFELQSETQQVLTENANKQAGLTISASYGPTVEATASASTNTTSSRQASTRVASSFARETTARAVSRVQKRKFEKRMIKTVREFEERNLHRFEAASADISGVYRFVDKIYTAQVVNYGKRLMLEFIVPEPAAFWRFVQTRQPATPISIECPQPPGYCIEADGSFAPLQPQDIDPEHYQFWAAQYGAEGVEPPPPKTRVVSTAKKGPDPIQPLDTDGPKASSDSAEIDIPDGYVPVKVIVNAYGETQIGKHKLMIQVQDKQFQYSEPWDDLLELVLHQEAVSKIPVSINSLRFHNYEALFTIFCVLRKEKYEEWQLKTYFSIINAYQAAKSRYENAIQAAQLTASYSQSFGRSAANNRIIEANELKRACITLMSGQHFETFDAMMRQAGPHQYPEINLAEAEAEARFVRLFEHGLDWMNITYVFYPYFWTRKDQWVVLSQLNDDDPLFAQFLQAGSARVQVPVRIGFDGTIMNYLSGIEIWDAEGNLINFEESGTSPQLTILQELKSRLSNEFEEGVGTLALIHDDRGATGTDTAFTDADNRRRIRIGTATYVIDSVTGQTLQFDRPYEGATSNASRYALGPRLVGEPWEVRIPTDLVKLADAPIH